MQDAGKLYCVKTKADKTKACHQLKSVMIFEEKTRDCKTKGAVGRDTHKDLCYSNSTVSGQALRAFSLNVPAYSIHTVFQRNRPFLAAVQIT